MATDIHVLTTEGGRVQFALHIAVPNGNNSVAVNWRTALVNSGIGGTTRLKTGDGTAGTIDATEAAAIANGSLYEKVIEKGLPSNWGSLTAGQQNSWLDALYNANAALVLSDLQARLHKFGHVRVVT